MQLRGNLERPKASSSAPEVTVWLISLSRFLPLCLFVPLLVLERCYPKEVQELYDAMRRFARVAGPTEHDKFIESHAC